MAPPSTPDGARCPSTSWSSAKTDRDSAFQDLGNVVITGPYEEAGVQGLLRSHGCDFAWFPAVWPETYSFTLSTANAAGLYPVAFNLGAIAERIREAGWGALLPFNLVQRPDEIARLLDDNDSEGE